ncbi:MAG: hypothetical protein EBY28_21220 [Betaproteobacteria bacterium]|nr:hypothetical protein [Betaproteobacteria bacterium]
MFTGVVKPQSGQPLVQLAHALDCNAPVGAALDLASVELPRPRAQGRVARGTLDPRGQPSRVARREQAAGRAVDEPLPIRWDVGREREAAAGHRLVQRNVVAVRD